MSITRRGFIKLGAVAGVFAGANLFASRYAAAQTGKLMTGGALPPTVLGDPLYALTATNFNDYVGSEFMLVNPLDGSNFAAVLSNVAAAKTKDVGRDIKSFRRRKSTAENYTLTFAVPPGDSPQATYALSHPALGQFDMFLVPGATDTGENLLHAVINRI